MATPQKVKSKTEEKAEPNPLLGFLVGAASGLIAAGVMNGIQAAASAMSPKQDEEDDPATIKAADKVSELTTGQRVPSPARKHAGNAVHYLTGAALGALYGVAAEYEPVVTAGYGTAYGAAVAVVVDDAIVPALGLGDAPWESSPATLAYGMASHLAFGAALEGSRKVMLHGVERAG